MKNRSTFWALLLSGFGLVSLVRGQDAYFQEGSKSSETWARSLTSAYQPELVLRSRQVPLFRKKLEEFLIRENKIQKADISVQDKMALLTQLADQQRAEMSNILTRPQLRRYTKVRREIQPIMVVVDTLNH